MKQYRTADQVKKYDNFKVITCLILVILLFLSWSFLRPQETPPAVAQATTEAAVTQPATSPPPATATSQPTATTAPTQTPPPTPTPLPPTVKPEPTLIAPVVNLPTGQVMPGQVALTGTGEPGSEVEIVIDGKVAGKATVGSDGTWSFKADLPEPGDYHVGVQNVDADGKVLASAKPVTLTVAAPMPTPTAPTLDVPSEELTTGPVTLSGTGEPGSKIEVVVDGKVAGTATVGDDGKWSLEIELSQAGDHEIVVQSVDADGKVLAAAEPVKLAVAEKVVPPTLDLPKTKVAAGPVMLTGTGKPGSEVEIVIDGKVAGKATVGSDGTWSFKADLSEPGDYQVGVRVVDTAGKVLAASKPVALTVVAPPTLDRPAGKLTTGPVTLSGTGEPGSKIEVVVDGKVAGTATVGDDGKWSLEIELSQAGDHEIAVQSVDADGKVLAAAEPIKLVVAEKVVPPTLDLPKTTVAAGPVALTGTGKPGSEVEIVIDGKVVGKATVGSDGTWSFKADLPEPGDYQVGVRVVDTAGKVLAASKPAALTVVAPPTLNPPDKELTTGPVTLSGTGEPGSKIEVVVDGKVAGTATVGDDGKWSFSTDVSQAGDYEVIVRSIEADGQILAASRPLKLAVVEAEKGQAYIVQLDDWLSKLALKFYNDMMAYPVIVDATNAKAKEDSSFTEITNPDLIEIGQKLWIPDTAP